MLLYWGGSTGSGPGPTYSRAAPHLDAHPDPNGHVHTNGHPPAHIYAYDHRDPQTGRQCDVYDHGQPYDNAHKHRHPYGHPHQHSNPNPNHYPDGQQHSYADGHLHPHRYAHANQHGYADVDTYADLDSNANSDLHLHTNPHHDANNHSDDRSASLGRVRPWTLDHPVTTRELQILNSLSSA